MGAVTSIEWADASWTPIRARFHEIQNDGSGKERIGWHCEHVEVGDGSAGLMSGGYVTLTPEGRAKLQKAPA